MSEYTRPQGIPWQRIKSRVLLAKHFSAIAGPILDDRYGIEILNAAGVRVDLIEAANTEDAWSWARKMGYHLTTRR